MPWFPDMASPVFCETLHLRKLILDRQQASSSPSSRQRILEPGSAEFISALAAGSNSRRILHIGCGLSTLALAVAARATCGYVECVDGDQQKQAVVARFVSELSLSSFVRFQPASIVTEPSEGFDFVLLTSEPESYIDFFDLLHFRHSSIIVAYNALDESTNDYIKHVRQQPGMDSSTLPVGRGIEVSKILCWDAFRAGRKTHSELSQAPTLTRSSELWLESAKLGCGSDDELNSRSSCVEEQDGETISPSVSIATSLEEESARIHDVVVASQQSQLVSISFQNSGNQTEIKVEGKDQPMLLADITSALNDASVSIQGAKISTLDDRVEDVFYVVDGTSKSVLDLDQQEYVRSKILKKIGDRI